MNMTFDINNVSLTTSKTDSNGGTNYNTYRVSDLPNLVVPVENLEQLTVEDGEVSQTITARDGLAFTISISRATVPELFSFLDTAKESAKSENQAFGQTTGSYSFAVEPSFVGNANEFLFDNISVATGDINVTVPVVG